MERRGKSEKLIGQLIKKRQQETEAFKKLLSAMAEGVADPPKKKRKSKN
jgi:hypothetical protein